MKNLSAMVWIEARKALRSPVPRWMLAGALFMPLAVGFLIFVSKNLETSQKLGLISAKADLIAFAAANWATYLELLEQLIATGGFIFFVFFISWVFGREFADGTLKDLLAVPAPRPSLLLAKFIIAALWSGGMTGIILLIGCLMGLLLHLPGLTPGVLLTGVARIVIVAGLAIAVVLPFGLIASIGRGYLLPVGAAVLILMTANLAAVMGRGEYFPWAVPGLYAQGKDLLTPVSYWIALGTGLAGILATILWWKYADQNR